MNKILSEMERAREAYWLRYPQTSPTKLRGRAVTVRQCFHVLPGESILEVGAGSGLWTEHLARAMRGECPITAAVFNPDLGEQACNKRLPNVSVALVDDLACGPPAESFNYVVGNAILCHEQYAQTLRALFRLLKPEDNSCSSRRTTGIHRCSSRARCRRSGAGAAMRRGKSGRANMS
ncbi:MAG TPA: class I SAM-dependent methyltransferase [Candidatus Binataceae bacterium]|nr:class I SAM-dependent methyltransferase [Candidatus Binataceae bacterium]